MKRRDRTELMRELRSENRSQSLYMGDHAQAASAEAVGFPHLAAALRQVPSRAR